jgi:hypothetical protein
VSGSLLTLLRSLAASQVEHVVIGGMAGVLQGVPVVTADLDFVHRRSPDNVARLLALLSDIQAVFRGDPRALGPSEHHLTGHGHLLLATRLGPLDLLCEVAGQGYEELVPDSLILQIGEGLAVRVVTLEKLIALKRTAGRPKDLLALPTIEATRDELRRRK